MPVKLHRSDRDFDDAFARFLSLRDDDEKDVRGVVSGIVLKVRADGDEALLDYTEQFDDVGYDTTTMRVSTEEMEAAQAACAKEVVEAMHMAVARVRDYHEKQMPTDHRYTDDMGVELGWRYTPIDQIGLYVPGGLASYPSSVYMNAIPAQVAGVQRIAMVVPTPKGQLNPSVLVAAHICGIEEIYKVGGAQAVAALAYGTDSIAPVDKIVGPGNAYVAEAKRQVYGAVGIDSIAGPSEILVVADNQNDPEWVAADLLSQSEHSLDAQSILITDDADFANDVELALEKHLASLSRADVARKAWERFGAIIVVDDLVDVPPLVNCIAPEHLELAVADPEALLKTIRHAGAIFLGRHTSEALGDYVAGPSHVLPTSRTARFSSGLSVFDFIKRSSIIGCSHSAAEALAAPVETLAEAEGFTAHALSARLRRNK